MKTRIYCSYCEQLVAQLAQGSQVVAGAEFICPTCIKKAKTSAPVPDGKPSKKKQSGK